MGPPPHSVERLSTLQNGMAQGVLPISEGLWERKVRGSAGLGRSLLGVTERIRVGMLPPASCSSRPIVDWSMPWRKEPWTGVRGLGPAEPLTPWVALSGRPQSPPSTPAPSLYGQGHRGPETRVRPSPSPFQLWHFQSFLAPH